MWVWNEKNSVEKNNFFSCDLFKEIQSNLTLFMLAGYETTSSSLTYICYILAKHSDEQQTLVDEIESHYNSETNVY